MTTTALLLKACLFAAEKHQYQKRKGGDGKPYINHPIQVAALLAEAGVTSEHTLIAGLLHDTIEDTKTTHEEILELFGKGVADIVSECTDDKLLSKVQRKKLQLAHAAHASNEAKLVKLADKYANLTDVLASPPGWSKEIIEGYITWIYAIYLELKGVNKFFDQKFEAIYAQKGMIPKIPLDEALNQYYSLLNF